MVRAVTSVINRPAAAAKPEAVSAGATSHSCHPLGSQGRTITEKEQAQSEREHKPVTGGPLHIATPKTHNKRGGKRQSSALDALSYHDLTVFKNERDHNY